MIEKPRNRRHWSTTTDHDLYTSLKNLADNTRIPIARLLDEAIEDLLLKHKVINKKTKTP